MPLQIDEIAIRMDVGAHLMVTIGPSGCEALVPRVPPLATGAA